MGGNCVRLMTAPCTRSVYPADDVSEVEDFRRESVLDGGSVSPVKLNAWSYSRNVDTPTENNRTQRNFSTTPPNRNDVRSFLGKETRIYLVTKAQNPDGRWGLNVTMYGSRMKQF